MDTNNKDRHPHRRLDCVSNHGDGPVTGHIKQTGFQNLKKIVINHNWINLNLPTKLKLGTILKFNTTTDILFQSPYDNSTCRKSLSPASSFPTATLYILHDYSPFCLVYMSSTRGPTTTFHPDGPSGVPQSPLSLHFLWRTGWSTATAVLSIRVAKFVALCFLSRLKRLSEPLLYTATVTLGFQ